MGDPRPSLGIQPVPKTPEGRFPKVKSRTLSLPDRALVAYRKPKNMPEEEFSRFINTAAHQILARFNVRTIVVGVENWGDLKVLDEEAMASVGYIHKDRIFLLKEDVDMSKYTEDELRDIMTSSAMIQARISGASIFDSGNEVDEEE